MGGRFYILFQCRPDIVWPMLRMFRDNPEMAIEHTDIGDDGIVTIMGCYSDPAVDIIRSILNRYRPGIRFFKIDRAIPGPEYGNEEPGNDLPFRNASDFSGIKKMLLQLAAGSSIISLSSLARKAGTSRSVIYACIRAIERQGLIRIDKNRVVLCSEYAVKAERDYV